MNYKFKVIGLVTASIEIEVKASSLEKAKKQAIEIANDFPLDEWLLDEPSDFEVAEQLNVNESPEERAGKSFRCF